MRFHRICFNFRTFRTFYGGHRTDQNEKSLDSLIPFIYRAGGGGYRTHLNTVFVPINLLSNSSFKVFNPFSTFKSAISNYIADF